MPTTPLQSYLRLTHTGLMADGVTPNTSSLLINDMDVGFEYQHRKAPVYIPVGGFIDVPLTSKVIFSATNGTIASFSQSGMLEVSYYSYARDGSNFGGTAGVGILLNAGVAQNVRRLAGVFSLIINAGLDTSGFITGERVEITGLTGTYSGLNGVHTISTFTKGQDFAGANPLAAILGIISVGANIPAALQGAGVTLTLPDGMITHLYVSSGNAGGMGADVRTYIAGDMVLTGSLDPTKVIFSPSDMSSGENVLGVDSVTSQLVYRNSVGDVFVLSAGPAPVGEEVQVAKTGGAFTSVAAAVASIAGSASAANPYVVSVAAGVYDEPPFTVPAYVCVNGSGGLYTAVLRTTNNLAHFISGSAAAEVRNIAVVGPTGGEFACVDYQGTGFVPFRVKNIRLISGEIGVWCHPVTYGVCTVSEAINFTDGAITGAFMKATDWGELRVSNSSYRREAGVSCYNGFGVNGPNAYMVVDNCAFKDAGSTHGGFVNNGGYLRMTSCTFTAGTTALRIGPNGANSRINALSTVIRDAFTNDIVVSSPTGVVQYSGTAHDSKITVAAGASFVANFSDPAGGTTEGQVNIGEFYLGDIAGNEMPVRDYLWHTSNTGLVEGGEVTRNIAGGLKLDVAAGECFISLSGSTGLLEYYWNDTTLDMTDDSHCWIVVDSTGALDEVFSEPDSETSVVLAEVVTRSGAVVFLGSGVSVDTYQSLSKSHRYRYESNGPRCVSGVSTIADAVSLKLDIDGGSFYIGDNRLTVTSTTAITFTAWYRTGAGAWVAVPGQTLIDDEQYNQPAGGLAAIAGGSFTCHVSYVTATEDGPEYHVVYGQMVDPVKASLTLPTPPDWLSRTSCRSGQVIVLKSAGVIDSINDVRPFANTAAAAGTAVTEHSLLGGLAVGDDHPQYQLRTEKNALSGYCGLDAAGLVAQARLNMTAVPALDVGEPATASAGGGGVGAKPAWEDHVHEHGSLTGGSHHAVAVAGASAGFMSAADKTRLDTTVLTTRTVTAGNGLAGGGDLSANRAFAVSPHADGSIAVGAGGVQVGTLATDGQHGNLGGGALHANVIAAGAAGFMSGADKTKLDGLSILHGASHTNGVDNLGVLNGIQIAGGALQPLYGAVANTVCQGDDVRLSDPRTPTAHQASHVTGADQIGTFSAGNRGLVPAPDAGGGDAAKVLAGNGTWVAGPAPAAHASTHAVGQPDAVLPLSIGAAYTVFAQTASVSATTDGVEQTLVGAGVGTVTLPADFFTVGKTLRIKASGRYTRTNPDTLRVRAYLGGTTALDSGVKSPPTISDVGWIMDIDMTCRTTGALGTIMAQGRIDLASSATASNVWQLVNAGTVTVNTAGALIFNLTGLWAGAGNSITCTNLVLTALN